MKVIAGVPHYPGGKIPREFRSGGRKEEIRNRVFIRRVPLPSINRAKMPLRLLQFCAYQAGAAIAGRNEKFDVLMMYGPALEMWLPFMTLGVRKRIPIVYSVHDIYPEVGIKSGIFRHRAVVRFVDTLERSCLMHADRIRILSTSFQDSLLVKGVPEERLRLVYDWVDIENIQPIPRVNSFAIENRLTENFVVLYSGNMGYVQALDNVINAAMILKQHEDILFVFVGEGAARSSLIEKVKTYGLLNVRFIGWQPAERMPEVYATGDVCIVSLSKGMAFDALPSKSYAIMAAKRPVISCVDRGSDAWNLVERAGAGIPVPPESAGDLSEAIIEMRDNKALTARFAQQGREYVAAHHSPASAAQVFEKILYEAVSEPN